ncbi:MAG TPA: flagellar basal-body MS-ring/collar protein FliF [Aromatoleum sp.]|uniref:flagellar basal-body MS-ring/collar protein FliF n=1 Tax=Aromatoleum sp. TaxID=2307007 RepID=UPI002B45FC78|nr:flagellar basal-body MS-ring/collar protein FliF [Aromatoleum sp.]HJV26675.1 flagellar basal-body MS-ring/collar protein FliF [Aromatoleum sp.]
MATADTAAPAPTPAQLLLQRINELTQRQKIAAAAAIAIAIAMLVGVWLWTRQPEYAVLFSNLEERDGGNIVTTLQQQNVPYRFSPGGNAILVPANQVHDIRLRLAAQGLPKGGLVGFELMENQKLGVSQFHEQVNFQRALEGELARTIQSISSVASARVHLAIPKQSGFLRDEQKPTASVMVNLHPGRTMDAAQVAGIVHLVASSVPQLANDRVSVIDQNGNLLTSRSDPLRNAGLDATQLNYVREVENSYIRRIETILTPLVGPDNFKAQVTADVDFNQVEETAETFKPNPSPDQAIRSQQTSEQSVREPGAQGVPGALTNQPPVPATAPITSPNVPGGGTGAAGAAVNGNRAATINYELDRTVQHTKQSVGQVKRLSVAIVVNQRSETLPNGQTRQVALTDEEVNRITSLVREAMGYSQKRGDTLNVSSAQFAAAKEEGVAAVPIWKDPEIQEIGKEVLKYMVILVALAFVYFGVIRPLIRSVAPAKAEGLEGAHEPGAEGEEEVLVSLSGAAERSFDHKLAEAKELAKTDPKVIANLIKEWMGTNEEAKK